MGSALSYLSAPTSSSKESHEKVIPGVSLKYEITPSPALKSEHTIKISFMIERNDPLKGIPSVWDTVNIPVPSEEDPAELLSTVQKDPKTWIMKFYNGSYLTIDSITHQEKKSSSLASTKSLFIPSEKPLQLADSIHSDPLLLEKYLGCPIYSSKSDVSKGGYARLTAVDVVLSEEVPRKDGVKTSSSDEMKM